LKDNHWILVGDYFNVITDLKESTSTSDYAKLDVEDFVNYLNIADLFDHLFNGPLFTWSNRQVNNLAIKKLDKSIGEWWVASEVLWWWTCQSCSQLYWLLNPCLRWNEIWKEFQILFKESMTIILRTKMF